MKIANTRNHDFYVWFISIIKSYFYGALEGTRTPIRVIREHLMLEAAATQGDPMIAGFLLRLRDPKESNSLVVEAIRVLNAHAAEVGFRLAKEPEKKNGRNVIFTPVQKSVPVIPNPLTFKTGLTIDEKLEVITRLLAEVVRDRGVEVAKERLEVAKERLLDTNLA